MTARTFAEIRPPTATVTLVTFEQQQHSYDAVTEPSGVPPLSTQVPAVWAPSATAGRQSPADGAWAVTPRHASPLHPDRLAG